MRPLLLVSFLLAATSFGQTRTPERTAPKTEFVFDGDLIEGTTQAPDVELLTKETRPRHEGLLKVRTEFRREVLSSVSQL